MYQITVRSYNYYIRYYNKAAHIWVDGLYIGHLYQYPCHMIQLPYMVMNSFTAIVPVSLGHDPCLLFAVSRNLLTSGDQPSLHYHTAVMMNHLLVVHGGRSSECFSNVSLVYDTGKCVCMFVCSVCLRACVCWVRVHSVCMCVVCVRACVYMCTCVRA